MVRFFFGKLFTFAFLSAPLLLPGQPESIQLYSGVGAVAAFNDDRAGFGPLVDVGLKYSLDEKWAVGMEYSFSYYHWKRTYFFPDTPLIDPSYTAFSDRNFYQANNHDLYVRAHYAIWRDLKLQAGLSLLNLRNDQEVFSFNGRSISNHQYQRWMVGYHYDAGISWTINKISIEALYSFVHRKSLQKVFLRCNYTLF